MTTPTLPGLEHEHPHDRPEGLPTGLRPGGTTKPGHCPDCGRAILAGYESDRLVSRPTMLDAARTAVELAGA